MDAIPTADWWIGHQHQRQRILRRLMKNSGRAIVLRNGPDCSSLALFLLAGLLFVAIDPAWSEGLEDVEWRAWGGDRLHRKYSPLADIDVNNVDQLEVAWTFDTEVTFHRSELQTTPLFSNGRLYVAGADSSVFALDPSTGDELWRFAPNQQAKSGRTQKIRGFAIWGSGSEERLFTTVGGKLVALRTADGLPIESFGESGFLELSSGLGRESSPGSVRLTSPGVIFEDLLIIGSTVSEVYPSLPGHIRAIDVRTGEFKWIFHTIPQPGERGYETWPEDAWTYVGGANAWGGASLDPERGIAFFGLGSASFDIYGGNRAGDNLYANSVLALDAETGQYLWHFQATRHDIWDRDLPGPPVLATIDVNGVSKDVAVMATKNGRIFVLDRQTGESVFPISERATFDSTVPGEVVAKTQPWPITPPVIARQKVTDADLTRRNRQEYLNARETFEDLSARGAYDPASLQGTILFPETDGAVSWGSGALDPEKGMMIFNTKQVASIIQLVPNAAPSGSSISAEKLYDLNCAACHGADRQGSGNMPALLGLSERYSSSEVHSRIADGGGQMPGFKKQLSESEIQALTVLLLEGTDQTVLRNERTVAGSAQQARMPYRFGGFTRFVDSTGNPATTPPWGLLTAVDLNSGRVVWQRPFGENPALDNPEYRNSGSRNYGGGVITASGLFFIGASLYDRQIRAFDVRSGQELWRDTLPASATAIPAIYKHGGRQFVVIAAGGGKWGAPSGSKYVAYALPITRDD